VEGVRGRLCVLGAFARSMSFTQGRKGIVSRQGAKDAKNCGWMARAPPESSARGRVLRDASHSPIRHPRESPVPYSIRGRDPCCLGGGPPGCRRRASPLTPRPPLPRGERGDVGPRMRRGRRAPPRPAACANSSLARPLFGRRERTARHPEESRGGVRGGFAFLAPWREFCLFPRVERHLLSPRRTHPARRATCAPTAPRRWQDLGPARPWRWRSACVHIG
jgi:hypothetical protein